MIEGNCLCGGIIFRIDPSKIFLFNNCYCKNCQREAGTGFVNQLQLAYEDFEWVQGKELIQRFESSPEVSRSFCRVCGSRVPVIHNETHASVPAGLLNDDIELIPEVNIHIQSKAHWALLDHQIPSALDQGSPEFWKELMEGKNDA